ncbi:MAG: endonuclease/exonuclease/phosphatase family protein [Armatimonadota bacterium]|nr:endonuclease/exonuclease/phosphatase family protein [Armatimonadota bacterium]
MGGELSALSGGSRSLWLATLAAAAIVLGACVLQRWPGDRRWWGAVITYAPQFVWPIVPAIALAWSLAARSALPGAVNAAVLLVALLGPTGLRVNLPAGHCESDLTIATWNLLKLQHRAEEFAARLDGCDVICLQEAEEVELGELLEGYEQARERDARTLVRGRILSIERIRAEMPDLGPALACEMEIGGRRLKVLNVHIEMSQPHMKYPYLRRLRRDYLRHTVRVREAQYDAILRWLEGQDLPVVIAGDLNTPPPSRFYRAMRRRLTDCFAATGLGTGCTFLFRSLPLFRIDYVWLGAGLRPVCCRIDRAAPSDHRPVFAEIEFTGETAAAEDEERSAAR